MRKNGTVKWFNKLKGHGFICPDEGGADVFVHYSSIEGDEHYKNLDEGDRVSFDLADFGRGPCAQKVAKIRT